MADPAWLSRAKLTALKTEIKQEPEENHDVGETSTPSNAPDGKEKSEGVIDPVLLAELRLKGKRENRKKRQKRKKEMWRQKKLAQKLLVIEEQVSERVSQMEANLLETVESERKNSGKYLSLARKYYGMWKSVNEQLQLCQQKSASNSKEGKDSTSSQVRFHFYWFLRVFYCSNTV